MVTVLLAHCTEKGQWVRHRLVLQLRQQQHNLWSLASSFLPLWVTAKTVWILLYSCYFSTFTQQKHFSLWSLSFSFSCCCWWVPRSWQCPWLGHGTWVPCTGTWWQCCSCSAPPGTAHMQVLNCHCHGNESSIQTKQDNNKQKKNKKKKFLFYFFF